MPADVGRVPFLALSDALQRVMPESPKTEAALRMLIAQRMKEAREFNGLTQVAAAKQMGYENSTQLSLHESGGRMPTLVVVVHAAAVYGVPVDYLLGLTDEPERDPRMAARIAAIAATRTIVDSAVTAITDHVAANLVTDGLAHQVIDEVDAALRELADAFAVVRRRASDDFDELIGGGRLERAIGQCQALMPKIGEARSRSAVSVTHNACQRDAEPDRDIKPMLRELLAVIRRGDDHQQLASLCGRAMAMGREQRRAARHAATRLSNLLQLALPEMDVVSTGSTSVN
jgi:transcriptional regulator with XRE-family HTH domain